MAMPLYDTIPRVTTCFVGRASTAMRHVYRWHPLGSVSQPRATCQSEKESV